MLITVQLQGVVTENDVLFIEIDPTAPISTLKERVEFQSAIPPSKQAIYYNGNQIEDDTKTIEQASITPDSLVLVVFRQQPREGRPGPSSTSSTSQSRPQQQQQQSQQPSSSSAAAARLQQQQEQAPPQQELTPEMMRQQYLSSPENLASLRYQVPLLADAINDSKRWAEMWEEYQNRKRELEEQRRRDEALLESDPFDIEAQRRIEELIRLQNVDENLEQTREYHPEAFGRVHMLYIPVEVNSHSVAAFVDSGAQTTIMSPDCAQRCGIMRLLDTRFSGIARGVGTAKILGRVHNAPIKIGTSFLPCSFTVMEGKDVELLLGLDMQKRHQAIIDLEKNVFRFQGNEVPFLGEADIPKGEEELRDDEPEVEGPGGTKIGGISGTVKDAPGKGKGTESLAGGSGSGASASTPSSAQVPATPQQQQSGPPGGGGSGQLAPFPEADIARLTDMGMGRAEAIQALTLAGGNVDAAASLMFS